LGSAYRCETGFCRLGSVICPANALQKGDTTREVVVNGVTRTYALHVPAVYAGESPVPLIVDFHPMGAGAWQWEQSNSGLKEISDQEGPLVVWPQGVDNTWNVGPCCGATGAPDDFEFARAIVRQLSTDACIDPGRVYATGFSMGAAVAYYLGCKQAEVFAAVAASSMDLFADAELPCQPSRAVTEISYRGTSDTVVPYAGGTSNPPGRPDLTNQLLGAKGTFEKWAAIDQCTGAPSAEDANGCSSYSGCRDNAEVTLCTTQGGAQVMGSATLTWQTLKRHSMP
jgi:polyhydroxybutyrate depolymerase